MNLITERLNNRSMNLQLRQVQLYNTRKINGYLLMVQINLHRIWWNCFHMEINMDLHDHHTISSQSYQPFSLFIGGVQLHKKRQVHGFVCRCHSSAITVFLDHSIITVPVSSVSQYHHSIIYMQYNRMKP